MQTHFSLAQLADPDRAEANRILRTCVHCGFCLATCPTYLLLGDELDSPRGRIYLMKQMFEQEKPATPEVVKHIDRCLSCLACMTTCPSGVHYMHLVDQGRAHIEKTYRRPPADRWLRGLLALVLPRPGLFRLALTGASLGRFAAPVMPARLKAMLTLAPAGLPAPRSPFDRPQTHAARGTRRKRVALMTGCAQKALDDGINAATIRLLTRLGVEVVIPEGEGCCGAVVHHMGKERASHRFARANVAAWAREMDGEGLDAIIINTSGCGTTVKDYGHMLADDAQAADASRVASIACDITEFLAGLDLPECSDRGVRVAYHAACSLQHGQKVVDAPKALLARAGFEVVTPRDAHLCCGSAGTYNLLQPEISGELKKRKVTELGILEPDVIAAGNIGCIKQIASGIGVPVIHTVQLLDWAYGGPKPDLGLA